MIKHQENHDHNRNDDEQDAAPAGLAPDAEQVMRVEADAMLDNEQDRTESAPETAPETGEEAPAPDAADADDESPAAEAEADGNAGDPPAEESVSELDALRGERDMYLDLARRERADFDNYRKRVQRQMADIKRESLAGFLKDFFGPLDDMDRVLQESAKNQSFDSLVTGVRIMEENFWRVLARAGVKRIDALGKPFDPALHEAMTTAPSADAAPNTIIEVFENGYKLDNFVLRPARVVVSRAPDE